MRAERLFRILGLVDDDLIEEAGSASSAAAPERRARPRRALAAAACLVLICGLGLFLRAGRGNMNGADGLSPGSGGAGGGGHGDGTTFMSYAGPVFPLTAQEPAAELTAERALTWDFAAGADTDGEPRQWGARVTDTYTLSNPTDADVTVTALYPFAGSFDGLADIRPTVAADGREIQAELYAGPFSGGLQDMEGNRDPEGQEAWNLYDLDSWESYRTLLESGAYRIQALADYPALDLPVTVYRFTDFAAPHGEYRAATQAVTFAVDETATCILSYGFNGYGRDETAGTVQYSYFVPNGTLREPETKMLVVLGEDIGAYTLQGYEDGGCEDGEEIEGVSCTVTRRKTTLDAVLDELCRDFRSFYDRGRATDQTSVFDTVPLAMYRGAVAEFMLRYTALSGAPAQRYSDGRLDDIFQEALFLERVFYLRFPLTVPAGGSVTVDCSLWKAPSYDFYCSGSENVGLQGYDLVTRLGSTLTFTRQTAALANTDGIEIVRQNLGFDPASGVTAVELDMAEEHYYLEIRERT